MSPLSFKCPHDFFFFVEAFSPSRISLSLSLAPPQTNSKITTTNRKKGWITDEFVVPPSSETQRRKTDEFIENQRPKKCWKSKTQRRKMEEFVEPPSSIQKLRPNTQKRRIVEPPSSISRILDLDFRFHHQIWSLCFSFSICSAIPCLPGFVVLFLRWLIEEKSFKKKKKKKKKKKVSRKKKTETWEKNKWFCSFAGW